MKRLRTNNDSECGPCVVRQAHQQALARQLDAPRNDPRAGYDLRAAVADIPIPTPSFAVADREPRTKPQPSPSPSPRPKTMPKRCTLHFFVPPSRHDAPGPHALVEHLIKHDYVTWPENAETANEAEGLAWEGTLATLCRYVDPRFSPLTARIRQAIVGSEATHEGVPISRLDCEKQHLHVWFRVQLAQGNSLRAVQALTTLLNGAGDVARDHLLGEELANAIHLAHAWALRPRVLPAAMTPTELASLFDCVGRGREGS